MLRIRLFGTGQAFYNGNELPGFPRHQAYQILCYLLLSSRTSHSRDSISSIFWSEYSSSSARKYLRNSIWRLKNFFEFANASLYDYVQVEDDWITYSFSSPYELDIEEFENGVKPCLNLPKEKINSVQIEKLEKSVNLYTGDLLESVYEDWCLVERERLGILYIKALTTLMNYFEFHHLYEQALYYGQKILEKDNSRESVHVSVMQLFHNLGDRDSAVRQYKICESILRKELNISPLPETQAIYHFILTSQSDRISQIKAQINSENSSDESHKVPLPPVLADQIQKKISRLYQVIDDTTAEIQRLENLLTQTQISIK